MEILHLLVIIITGFAAGFINTVAGGGSLLTLPVLIFLGLPPNVANASNRVAIFSQNIFGVLGFRSKGVSSYRVSLILGGIALVGAIIGARIAVDIEGDTFNKVLAVVMIVVLVVTIFKPRVRDDQTERTSPKHMIISGILFFFIGIYGGFIQVGVGFLIIAALTSVNGFSLVKTNSAKMMIVMVYTLSALAVFMIEGTINWFYGLILAVGNSSGAWFASRWSVNKGEKWIKVLLIVAVSVMAIRLWFFT